MKNAAKKWYNYLLLIAAGALPFGIGIWIYFGKNDASVWPLSYTSLTMVYGGIVLAGVGFIIQDIYRGVIRHKINDWDNPLEEKYLNTAWSIFFPLLFGGLLSFIAGLIMYMFVK